MAVALSQKWYRVEKSRHGDQEDVGSYTPWVRAPISSLPKFSALLGDRQAPDHALDD